MLGRCVSRFVGLGVEQAGNGRVKGGCEIERLPELRTLRERQHGVQKRRGLYRVEKVPQLEQHAVETAGRCHVERVQCCRKLQRRARLSTVHAELRVLIVENVRVGERNVRLKICCANAGVDRQRRCDGSSRNTQSVQASRGDKTADRSRQKRSQRQLVAAVDNKTGVGSQAETATDDVGIEKPDSRAEIQPCQAGRTGHVELIDAQERRLFGRQAVGQVNAQSDVQRQCRVDVDIRRTVQQQPGVGQAAAEIKRPHNLLGGGVLKRQLGSVVRIGEHRQIAEAGICQGGFQTVQRRNGRVGQVSADGLGNLRLQHRAEIQSFTERRQGTVRGGGAEQRQRRRQRVERLQRRTEVAECLPHCNKPVLHLGSERCW